MAAPSFQRLGSSQPKTYVATTCVAVASPPVGVKNCTMKALAGSQPSCSVTAALSPYVTRFSRLIFPPSSTAFPSSPEMLFPAPPTS
jgi:hypothetical protein